MVKSIGFYVSLIIGPLLFGIVGFGVSIAGLGPGGQAMLGLAMWMAIWWITEPIPIEVTALLPIVVMPLSGILDIASTTGNYGHPLIFLFLGGFVIALAIERWQLHRRIALNIILAVGSDPSRLILGFMLATAGLSMWISNTATSLMMLPIGLAIIAQKSAGSGNVESSPASTPFSQALLFSIAYSASIGGVATLIGTPPNLVFAGIVNELYGVEVDFAGWMLLAAPLSIILLFISWWYLTRVAFPQNQEPTKSTKEGIQEQLSVLGPLSKEEKRVLAVFVVTAVGWITRRALLVKLIPGLTDTHIAMIGAFLLFLLPGGKKPGGRIMDWAYAVRLPWGILLLFGGGLALAEGFTVTGLAEWIGNRMGTLNTGSLILMMLAVTALVNFTTEITSNVATASMILPVIATLAAGTGVHPYALMVPAVIAASCAFMLPVATPPNAVVFGSGHLKIRQMVRTGLALNLISIVVTVVYIYFTIRLIWGLDIDSFPPDW